MALLPRERSFKRFDLDLDRQSHADLIQSAIDYVYALGGGDLYLSEEAKLSTSFSLKNGVRLFGRRTTLLPSFGGAADLATNAAIKAEGSAGVATTLAVAAPKDATQITLTSATGLAVGDYLQIFGTNNSLTNSADDSDGSLAVLYELVKIASLAGAVATLAWPTSQYHAATVAVQKWTPVTDIGVYDLTIDASGGTLAVGLLARGVIGLEAQIRMRGASRALLELDQGSRDFDLDLYGEGENNALLHAVSAMHGKVVAESSSTGTRYHASGVPRGLLTFRQRCTDILIPHAALRHGCVGLVVAGGKHLNFGEVRVSDMDLDRAYTQWQTVGENTDTATMGAGIHMGYGPLNYAETSHDISFRSLSLENCRHQGEGAYGASAYLHDCHDLGMARLAIRNHGHWDTWMAGIVAADVGGYVQDADLQGVAYGLRTKGTFSSLQFDRFSFNGAPGTGSQQPFALWIGVGLPVPKIGILSVANAAGWIRFESGVNDPNMTIRSYFDGNGFRWGPSRIAYNTIGGAPNLAVGELVEIVGLTTVNGQSFLAVGTPTGANRRLAVVTVGAPNDVGTSFVMIAELPTEYGYVLVRSADVVAVGDLLEGQNGSREAAKNNASAAPLGKALSTKSSGAAANVLVGPV